MRIKQLKIEGFRSLKNVTWEPGDLNILIGPNGTGKSNLLRFIELMAVTAKGNLGKYIQSLGGMGAIVWDGQATNISFSLDCSGNHPLVPPSYKLELSRLGQSSIYSINRETLTGGVKDSLIPVEFINRDKQKAQLIRRNVASGAYTSVREIRPDVINEQETILSAISGFPVGPFDATASFNVY